MRIEQVAREICRFELRRGQVKRVPLSPARPLFGYIIVCPDCGRPTFATALNGDQLREQDGALTAARFRCDICRAEQVIADGEFRR